MTNVKKASREKQNKWEEMVRDDELRPQKGFGVKLPEDQTEKKGIRT